MIFTGAYHFRNPGSHVWVCVSLSSAPQGSSGLLEPQGLSTSALGTLLTLLDHHPGTRSLRGARLGQPRGQASNFLRLAFRAISSGRTSPDLANRAA